MSHPNGMPSMNGSSTPSFHLAASGAGQMPLSVVTSPASAAQAQAQAQQAAQVQQAQVQQNTQAQQLLQSVMQQAQQAQAQQQQMQQAASRGVVQLAGGNPYLLAGMDPMQAAQATLFLGNHLPNGMSLGPPLPTISSSNGFHQGMNAGSAHSLQGLQQTPPRQPTSSVGVLTSAGTPMQQAQQAAQVMASMSNNTMSTNSTPALINASRNSTQTPNRAGEKGVPRSEIYRYTSNDPLYASGWSYKPTKNFRLAVATLNISEGTPTHKLNNKFSIVQLDENAGKLVETLSYQTEQPINRLSFIPDTHPRTTERSRTRTFILKGTHADLIATCGDLVRIYRIVEDQRAIVEESQMYSQKSAQYSSTFTSMDWNEMDPTIIGASSIDTTCSIFDIETGQQISNTGRMYKVKTQLIAHDRPVHDIAFSRVHNGRDHFATVGADGSARMFDLRHLDHSTIVYEDPLKTPLMRIAWNKMEPYYIATFAQDSQEVVIVDIRMPCNPLVRLKNHSGAVNGIAWAPHSVNHLCTVGDDNQALIWDIAQVQRTGADDPILAYSAGGEVNQVQWGAIQNNWIAICFNKCLEILRV